MVEELEKELKKVNSSTSTAEADATALEAHRKKKQIDHEALQMKWDKQEKRQERKEAKKMNLKKKCFKNLEPLSTSPADLSTADFVDRPPLIVVAANLAI
jgi:hypothetical protein